MSSWTPAQLGSAVVVWLDAQNSGSITQAATLVSSWASTTPGTVTVTQATGADQPAYSATSFNSLPGLTFDGANDVLASTSVATPAQWTAICVASCANTGVMSILDQDPGIPNPRSPQYLGGNSTGSLRTVVNTSGGAVSPTTTYTTNTPQILAAESQGSGGNCQCTSDGSTPGTPSALTGTDITAANVIRVGNHVAGIQSLNGIIGEIILVTGVPSTNQRQILEGYLAWKWNLVSLLPGNHPYKGAAPLIGGGGTHQMPSMGFG